MRDWEIWVPPISSHISPSLESSVTSLFPKYPSALHNTTLESSPTKHAWGVCGWGVSFPLRLSKREGDTTQQLALCLPPIIISSKHVLSVFINYLRQCLSTSWNSLWRPGRPRVHRSTCIYLPPKCWDQRLHDHAHPHFYIFPNFAHPE